MKSLITIFLTILLLAVLLYFVPLVELLQAMRLINPADLLIAFSLYSSSQLIRSFRWKLILGNFTLLQVFLINSANIMFNNLLPARTGELSWFYYAKKLGVNFGFSLWSFLLGRLYDLLALFFLLFLSLSAVSWFFLLPSLLILVLSLGFFKFYNLLPRRGRLGQLRDYVESSFSLKLCVGLFLLSLFSAILKLLSLISLLDLWHMNLYRVFLGFFGGELSSALPLHSFMGLGTYEFAFGLPLKLLGESLSLWLRYAFVFHSFLLLSSLLWGVPSAILLSKGKL